MTHPDFRALCAELVEKIDYTWGYIPEDVLEVMERARAALAAPQQGAPMPFNNRDIQRITDDYWDKDKCTLDWVGVANEILRRYGAQAVAVAERSPGEGDCAPWPDETPGEPWCWFGRLIKDDKDVYFQWIQCWPKYGLSYKYTHWLPHWALPLPEAQP